MICTASYLFETFHAMMSMISLYNLESLIHEQYLYLHVLLGVYSSCKGYKKIKTYINSAFNISGCFYFVLVFFFLEKMEYEAGCKIRDFPKYEWSFR